MVVQQPCANTVQIEAVYSTPGGIAENVFHVKGTGPYTDINALSNRLATAYANWELANLHTTRATGVNLQTIRVRDIGQIDGPVVTVTPTIAGSTGGTGLPDNVSFPIKWYTARSGRSYRGRTFFIGLCPGQVANDQLTPANQANLVSAYTALRTALNSTGWLTAGDAAGQMVLVRRHYQGQLLVPAQAEPILGCAAASPYLATRRTRLAGRHLKR